MPVAQQRKEGSLPGELGRHGRVVGGVAVAVSVGGAKVDDRDEEVVDMAPGFGRMAMIEDLGEGSRLVSEAAGVLSVIF